MVDPTDSDAPSKDASPSDSSGSSNKGFMALAQYRYECFIEAGKRKLHYYDPEVSDSDRFIMSFVIYFMVLLMVVFAADYGAQLMYEDSDSLGPLQTLEAEIVYQVQKEVFDMPVVINRTSKTIWYDTEVKWRGMILSDDDDDGGFGLRIASVCTGFHEMVFLGVLVMGFRGPPVKIRAKWTAILLGVVFIENLFRIFILYPLALYKGRQYEEWFHYHWWHTGQYVFIMTLFVLWFFFVARKYIDPEEASKCPKKSTADGEEKIGEKDVIEEKELDNSRDNVENKGQDTDKDTDAGMKKDKELDSEKEIGDTSDEEVGRGDESTGNYIEDRSGIPDDPLESATRED